MHRAIARLAWRTPMYVVAGDPASCCFAADCMWLCYAARRRRKHGWGRVVGCCCCCRRRRRRRLRRRRRRGCDWTSRCRGLLVDACVRACGLWSVVVAVSVVVVVVVAEAVVVMSVVGGSSHLEFLSKHRALPFALRALVGAQGNTSSYEIRGEPLSEHRASRLVMRFVSVGRFLHNSWPASV